MEAVNNRQKSTLFAKLAQHFGGVAQLKGKTIAVWRLAFKPSTDDMRAAPSRVLKEALWQTGAKVQAFDPVAMKEADRIYPLNASLNLCQDKYAAMQGAETLVISTEWQQFRAPDFDEMAARLTSKVIVDVRNLYHPKKCWTAAGYISALGELPKEKPPETMLNSLDINDIDVATIGLDASKSTKNYNSE